MTTSVTVAANHGWPVLVSQVQPDNGEVIGTPVRVEKGTTYSTAAHSTADILVHEIQPGEEMAEDAPDVEEVDKDKEDD